MLVAKVCIPHTAKDYYDYSIGQPTPKIGARVDVSFRNRTMVGIVIGYGEPEKNSIQLKAIKTVIDEEALLSSEILSLCRWIGHYYQAPLSEILPLALPKSYRQGKLDEQITPPIVESLNVYPAPYSLNNEQDISVQAIKKSLDQYQCFLLYGVTGSGKTEVYLQVIQTVLQKNQQVLVLVPEIGLTPQWLSRFTQRFSYPMVVIHSHLTEKERQKAWHSAHTGQAQLIIGTRTAVFTSLVNLGLIIIDEEHDASFKQMEGPRYSARDVAIVRAHARNIPIILGSATPSLETLHNVILGKYQAFYLRKKAASAQPLRYKIIDMRQQKVLHGISKPALSLIKTHLEQKNQVLVFINRRGYAPVLLCHHCGWIPSCRDCDTHLTLHRQAGQVLCHHCGFIAKTPKTCSACQGHVLLPVGVGTQRIYEYLTEVFPDVAIARIDRDETKHKKALELELKKIESGETQLMIGTQMLAKGHHFPKLTLVVIVDTDQGFYNADFRALERLGQLITQVAGRAGRAENAGQVAIQTYLPQHLLLNQLIQSGYDAFAQSLLKVRSTTQLPPYAFMALISAQSKRVEKSICLLDEIKRQINHVSIKVLGPAPAPMARRATFYRYQLLLQTPNRQCLQTVLSQIRQDFFRHTMTVGVVWGIDVDPVDLS
jgi:primosomal protein N' (replication factor Y)